MTENEYMLQIEQLRSRIAKNDISGIEDQLSELYRFKPVRLIWFVTKAELLWKQERWQESWDAIDGKVSICRLYPGIDAYMEFHKKWMKRFNSPIEYQYLHNLFLNIKGISKNSYGIEEAFNNCLKSEGEKENLYLNSLMTEYFVENQLLVQQMLRYQLLHSGYIQNEYKDLWYYKESNYGYLEEILLSSDQEFIVVSDGKNQRECDVLLSVLHYFKKKVFMLMDPVDADGVNCLEDSMHVSLSNTEEIETAVYFPVIKYVGENGVNNNRCEMIQYICTSMTNRNYAILMTSGELFLEFMKVPDFQKHVECLSSFDEINAADKMYFGWTGNYAAYISDVYNMDVEQELSVEPECDFSIIIPARNSAGTLEYTIQTCLNQDYHGSYEIVVSDNSTDGNQEVYELCRDMGDYRIKYYKTPRNLPLSRSFEYAYLKSRGSFVFSIGSDDGVCPWALTYLDKILRKYPDEEVLQWQRGYYAWKGFEGPDEDKLIIPGMYQKDEVAEEFVDNIEYFARILKYKEYMYSLPLLYINSGCRRSYLKTLLNRTGRLWDGCNQDLYMGVMNAAINSRILNISFPITVAGASNNSLGYVSSLQRKDEEQEKLMRSTCLGDNVGIYITHGIVNEIPAGTAETCSLYYNLMRAIQLGVLPDSWRQEVFDYKKIFTEHFREHLCIDDKFDKYIHYALHLAKNRGEEFYNWFLENIYYPGLQPRYLRESPKSSEKAKTYQEGISESGGLIIDASNYGVTNIAEAIKVFEKFLYWTPESWANEVVNRNL